MASLLSVENVTKQFGGLTALTDVALHVDQGEIVGVIGPNGAGKTTLFNIITGLYSPTKGRIFLNGKEITNLPPHKIAALGFGRTFQNIRLFAKMSVLDNVLVAMHSKTKSSLFDAIFHTPRARREDKQCLARAEELLRLVDLWEERYEYASSLPYGKQRRLEIARALALDLSLLLLDEPAAGMNEQETQELLEIVRKLKQMNTTILLIEHDMKFVMNICERIYVLDYGRVIADGTPKEISPNQAVIDAYLGLLRVENLSVNYGSINALREVSFEVNQGEIVSLIGANGAGKTTIMNTVAALKEPSGGAIYFDDKDITRMPSQGRVAAGIVLSPEGRQVFSQFSVRDNLMMGGYLFKNSDNLKELEKVYDLFPRLKEREKQLAGTLSGGEQQMLAVARALMARPRLLLLDEPSMGLAPLIVKEIFNLIQRIHDTGTTVFLVEQNARAALKISDRAYVLETGKIALSGMASDLLQSEAVQKAYLGM